MIKHGEGGFLEAPTGFLRRFHPTCLPIATTVRLYIWRGGFWEGCLCTYYWTGTEESGLELEGFVDQFFTATPQRRHVWSLGVIGEDLVLLIFNFSFT